MAKDNKKKERREKKNPHNKTKQMLDKQKSQKTIIRWEQSFNGTFIAFTSPLFQPFVVMHKENNNTEYINA